MQSKIYDSIFFLVVIFVKHAKNYTKFANFDSLIAKRGYKEPRWKTYAKPNFSWTRKKSNSSEPKKFYLCLYLSFLR